MVRVISYEKDRVMVKFTTIKEISEDTPYFEHVLEGKKLFITDGDVTIKVVGKEQLLDMCRSLGIVGTGVRL